MIKKISLLVASVALSMGNISYAVEDSKKVYTNEELTRIVLQLQQELAKEKAKNNVHSNKAQETDGLITSKATKDDKDFLILNHSGKANNKIHTKIQPTTTQTYSDHMMLDIEGNGSNTLLANISSTRIAYSILSLKKSFDKKANTDRYLVLGGKLEADVMSWWGDDIETPNFTSGSATGFTNSNYNNGAGIYLESAKLYLLANANEWTQAYIEMGADGYSDFGVSYAAIIFGNLDKSPFYGAVGKTRMAMSNFYGGGLMIGTLTTSFRPSTQDNIRFGYNNGEGFNTNLAVFAPEKNVSSGSSDDLIDDSRFNFVYSLFTATSVGDFGLTFNAGYVYNVTTSGAGITKIYTVQGGEINKISTNTDDNFTKSGAVAFDLGLTYGVWSLAGTWASTLKKVNYSTVTTTGTVDNDNKERMGAWGVNLSYSPNQEFFGRSVPTTYGLTASGGYNMENVGTSTIGNYAFNDGGNNVVGVKNTYSAYVQREAIKDVFLGFELGMIRTYNKLNSYDAVIDIQVYF